MSVVQDLRSELAERQVSRLKEDLLAWRSVRADSEQRCPCLEDLIFNAVHCLEFIKRRLGGRLLNHPDGSACDSRARQSLREWVQAAKQVVESAARVENECGRVEGTASLRAKIAEVQGYLGTPMPVRFDDEGRVFDMSGEQVEVPGLAPEEITEGLADATAARMRPLKEIITSWE